jgi:HD superfamily phosphohydrolase
MSEAIQIRDPIHTFISLDAEQAKIVDTPIFQRLRNIRQLALASLVYPGALHTRFEHSLGVFHVACEMLRRLGLENGTDARAVRFAALLHDLGHGPFSHVSEQSLNMFADRGSLPAEQKNEKIHELITANLIRRDTAIIKVIGEDIAETVVRLLNDWDGDPVMQAIISGPLDADKLDYLLRDSYFCGVAYGRFDSAQLLRSFRCDNRQLLLEWSGMTAFEQYALAKFYISQNVYRH